jgi:hypothetical protein
VIFDSRVIHSAAGPRMVFIWNFGKSGAVALTGCGAGQASLFLRVTKMPLAGIAAETIKTRRI